MKRTISKEDPWIQEPHQMSMSIWQSQDYHLYDGTIVYALIQYSDSTTPFRGWTGYRWEVLWEHGDGIYSYGIADTLEKAKTSVTQAIRTLLSSSDQERLN